MTSYNMVLQSQLELMMKIAKKRPEIDKSMIILLPMLEVLLIFSKKNLSVAYFSKNLTRLVA